MYLTLSGLNLPLSSSSTTSRELLSQFSICSGWRWCDVKIKENCYALVNQVHRNFRSNTLCCRKIKSVFRDVKWCFNASWGLKQLTTTVCFRMKSVSLRVLMLKNQQYLPQSVLFGSWFLSIACLTKCISQSVSSHICSSLVLHTSACWSSLNRGVN